MGKRLGAGGISSHERGGGKFRLAKAEFGIFLRSLPGKKRDEAIAKAGD